MKLVIDQCPRKGCRTMRYQFPLLGTCLDHLLAPKHKTSYNGSFQFHSLCSTFPRCKFFIKSSLFPPRWLITSMAFSYFFHFTIKHLMTLRMFPRHRFTVFQVDISGARRLKGKEGKQCVTPLQIRTDVLQQNDW